MYEPISPMSNIPYEYKGVVKFEECCFVVDNPNKKKCVSIFDEIGVWEVVGNIYENKGLMK